MIEHKKWCTALTGGNCICKPRPARQHVDRYDYRRDSAVSEAQREQNLDARKKGERFGMPGSPKAEIDE